MKLFCYIWLFFWFCGFSQEEFTLVFKDAIQIDAQKIYGVDTFGTMYYSTKDQTFYKKSKDTLIAYSNFRLGEIFSADTFNPLKIKLFYKDYNTLVVLDNRLAEVFLVDFNTLQSYKNVSHLATGNDNTVWIFNQDQQNLELYNYKSNTTRFKSIPIPSNVLDLKSDYNYCYLLTKNHLYIFNYFGSLINKLPNTGYTKMAFGKSYLILQKENNLFVLPKNNTKILPINPSIFFTEQFLVTNETLYIYQNKTLTLYQLKP